MAKTFKTCFELWKINKSAKNTISKEDKDWMGKIVFSNIYKKVDRFYAL